jgi:hypothetical protein
VPRQERGALLAGFATHVNLTRISRSIKRMTIYWRDGSTTTRDVGLERPDYYWTAEDYVLLQTMIESDADQVTILKAFPEHNWRALKQRYAFKFNKMRWPKTYAGKITYTERIRWRDTAEYRAEHPQTQPTVNEVSTSTCLTRLRSLSPAQSSHP